MFRELTEFFDSMARQPGMNPIQVGLDGSWGQISPHVFSYGGVAGNQAQWNALDPIWMGLLTSNCLDEFHMVDAVNFRGEFIAKGSEWGQDRLAKQDAIICAFIDAIRGSGLQIVAVSAEAGLLSDESVAAKKRDVFEKVVRDLHAVLPRAASLVFICDREQDLVKPVMNWLEKIQVVDPSLAERIAGVCYMKRRAVLQIQAADLVAYLYREEIERLRHRPNEPANRWFMRLSADQSVARFRLKSQFLA